MAECKKCGKQLSFNDIGAHKNLVNRGSTSFFCRECLAEEFKVDPALIDRKIEEFKKQGCTLFV